jgi:hypothetical protein
MFLGDLKTTGHSEDIPRDGRIILKMILKKQSERE